MGLGIKKYLLNSLPALQLKSLLDKIRLPGSPHTSWLDILKVFFHGINEMSISLRASSAAYRFFLALFPGLIFLFSLIPYIPIENFQAKLLELLKDVLPKNAYELTNDTFQDMINNPRGGLLSIGFLAALYFSTNGIHSMISAFNYSIHVKEKRSEFRQRMVSVLLVIVLTILLVLCISLLIVGAIALNYLEETLKLKGAITITLLEIGQWVVVFALFFFATSLLYYLGPAKTVRFKFLNPGAFIATMLTVITSLGFSFYVNNFGQFNKLYGSIGTIMVIMLLIYFNSWILLLGFELNASIYLARKEREHLS